MNNNTIPKDAAAATDRESWLSVMEEIGDEAGYFERLGHRHWAFFVDDSPTLLVTFESLGDIRSRGAGQMPMGHDIARANGWSHLCVIAEGPTWYRDHRVWGYFDRLVDDAFFEDFDQVVFHGAGLGGYAACAYSVAAPGCTVLAIRPRATMAPADAGWDWRDRAARRLDFSSRYGYAPDMIDGAKRVFIVVDPAESLDAMHANLFRKPFVTRLNCRYLGPEPEASLAAMSLLHELVEAATNGTLSKAAWAKMWRARKTYGPWLRNVLARLSQSGTRLREAVFCRAVVTRMSAPRFRRRLNDLTEELTAVGIELPKQRD